MDRGEGFVGRFLLPRNSRRLDRGSYISSGRRRIRGVLGLLVWVLGCIGGLNDWRYCWNNCLFLNDLCPCVFFVPDFFYPRMSYCSSCCFFFCNIFGNSCPGVLSSGAHQGNEFLVACAQVV